VVVDEQRRIAFLDRSIAIGAAFAVLWILEQRISVIGLVSLVVFGSAAALGCSRLSRWRAERRELLAWVEQNRFSDQTISEWLTPPYGPVQHNETRPD